MAGVAVLHMLWLGRLMGVSGHWKKLARWREYRRVEREDTAMSDSDLVDALVAATMEEIGEDAEPSEESPDPAPGLEQSAQPPPRLTAASSATFLAMLVAGGFAGAMLSDRFEIRADLGEAFAAAITADQLWTWVVLLLGGVLVGFGTTMSGGCTSGHGLSGCSRLDPASLIGTATFFGVAIATALLIGALLP